MVTPSTRVTFTRLPAGISSPRTRAHRIVDGNGADAVDDQLLQCEHASDERLGATIEKRLIGRSVDLFGEPSPQRDRREREGGENDALKLP